MEIVRKIINGISWEIVALTGYEKIESVLKISEYYGNYHANGRRGYSVTVCSISGCSMRL